MRFLSLALLAVFTLVFIIEPAFASKRLVQVTNAYTKVLKTMPQGQPLGVFMQIKNLVNADDVLQKITTPQGYAELHSMDVDANGIMRMRQLQTLTIPPKGTVKLEPGGLHIMLFDVQKMPKAGDALPLMLHFKNAGKVKVIVKVKPMGAVQ